MNTDEVLAVFVISPLLCIILWVRALSRVSLATSAKILVVAHLRSIVFATLISGSVFLLFVVCAGWTASCEGLRLMEFLIIPYAMWLLCSTVWIDFMANQVMRNV